MSIWKPTWNFVPITFYETIGNLENMTQCTRIQNNLRGKTLRIKFTNRGNSAPLILDHVTLSVRNRVTNQITRHAEVSHNGQKNIFLAPEEEFDSDEIPLSVSEEDDLEVRIYFAGKTPVCTACSTSAAITWSSCYQTGDATGKDTELISDKLIYPEMGGTGFATGFYEIAIETDSTVQTVSLFGDSITNMAFFSDALTQMLYKELPGQVSVLNAGISGNRITRDAAYIPTVPGQGRMFGISALKRAERDLFGNFTPDLIFMLEGINDCTHSFEFGENTAPTGEELWNATASLIDLAHDHGSKIILSTVMPFGSKDADWRPAAEEIRQTFNKKIRSQTIADAVLDLDAHMRQSEDPLSLKEGLHIGDGLHPNADGGVRMAEALLPLILSQLNA